MSLRTITITVDQAKFFDEVREYGLISSTCPIGSRVIACLLGGVDWREAMGLGSYGVSVIEEQQSPAPTVKGEVTAPSGWVVTNASETQFRAWDSMGSCWVDDLAEAVYYARRKDAEAVHAEDIDAWRVIERPLPAEA